MAHTEFSVDLDVFESDDIFDKPLTFFDLDDCFFSTAPVRVCTELSPFNESDSGVSEVSDISTMGSPEREADLMLDAMIDSAEFRPFGYAADFIQQDKELADYLQNGGQIEDESYSGLQLGRNGPGNVQIASDNVHCRLTGRINAIAERAEDKLLDIRLGCSVVKRKQNSSTAHHEEKQVCQETVFINSENCNLEDYTKLVCVGSAKKPRLMEKPNKVHNQSLVSKINNSKVVLVNVKESNDPIPSADCRVSLQTSSKTVENNSLGQSSMPLLISDKEYLSAGPQEAHQSVSKLCNSSVYSVRSEQNDCVSVDSWRNSRLRSLPQRSCVRSSIIETDSDVDSCINLEDGDSDHSIVTSLTSKQTNSENAKQDDAVSCGMVSLLTGLIGNTSVASQELGQNLPCTSMSGVRKNLSVSSVKTVSVETLGSNKGDDATKLQINKPSSPRSSVSSSIKVIHVKTSKNSTEDDIAKALEERNRKNAEVAKDLRRRKKMYLQSLESKVKEDEQKFAELEFQLKTAEKARDAYKKEVEYLKAVIANQSALATLLKNIPNTLKNVNLSKKFVGDLELDHNHVPPNDIIPPQSTAGVCIHVDSDTVSLEFCHHCAESSQSQSALESESSFNSVLFN